MLRISLSRRLVVNASAISRAAGQKVRASEVAAAQAVLTTPSCSGGGQRRVSSLAIAAAAVAMVLAASRDRAEAEARGEQPPPPPEPRLRQPQLVRVPTAPRRGWREAVASEGVTYHTDPPPAGTPFWHDGAFYCLSTPQAETLRRATAELHHLCLQAVAYAVQHDEVLARLGIAPHMWSLIKHSWRHRDTTDCGVYGRFDLRYAGGVPPAAVRPSASALSSSSGGGGGDDDWRPKMLEYNADTPTCLLEAGDAQAAWARDYARRVKLASDTAAAGGGTGQEVIDPPQLPSPHQFNEVHAQLVRGWERWLAGHVVLPPGTAGSTSSGMGAPTSIMDIAAAAALPRDVATAHCGRAPAAAAPAAAPAAPPLVVPIHFACVSETDEDYRTVQFMARCASEAVLRDPTTGAPLAVIEPRFVFIEDVGWDDAKRCFVDTGANYQLASGRPFPHLWHQPTVDGAAAGSGTAVSGVRWTDASAGLPRRAADTTAPVTPAGSAVPGSSAPAPTSAPAPLAVVPVPAAALTDGRDRAIRFLFKLYPYEHLASDAFAKHVVEGLDAAGFPVDLRYLAEGGAAVPGADAAPRAPRLRASPLRVEFIEPAWKMVLSNKAILPLLWELFPGHPNLLPAFWGLHDERARAVGMQQGLCAKPMLSREGANIVLFRLEKMGETASSAAPPVAAAGAATPRAAALAANPIIRSLQEEAAKHGLRVVVDHATEGTYGSGAYVLQARCEPPRVVPTPPLLRALAPSDVLAWNAAAPPAPAVAATALPVTPACPVIGSWVIDHQPAGVIFREDSGPVTNNKSLFIPHLVAPPARMA